MAISDIYEAIAHCSLGNQASVSKRFWRVSNEAGTGATVAQIASWLANHFGGALKACLSSSATYHGIAVRRIWPGPVPTATVDITGAGAGGVAGDPCPRQVRGLVTLTTGLAGRVGRGRIYVPFPAEASNDANATPTAGYFTLLELLGVELSTVFVGVGAGGNTAELTPHLVIPSYTPPPLVVISHVRITKITGYTARDKWATQRRSGDYGSPNVIGI